MYHQCTGKARPFRGLFDEQANNLTVKKYSRLAAAPIGFVRIGGENQPVAGK
jgi:hypothetical protein